MRNRTSRLHERGPEWAIVVRRPGGSGLFYCPPGRGRLGQTEWGLASQARRYETEAAARAVAATFNTNRDAVEYVVVRLPPAT